jgi:enterochelin esterase-like enzyme
MRWRNILMLAALSFCVVTEYEKIAIASPTDTYAQQTQTTQPLKFRVKTFESKAMGTKRKYGLVLPPDYQDAPTKHYPVIFILHGGHGNATTYQEKARLTSVLQDLYQSGKLPPSIVVTPDGSDRRGSSHKWDPEYYNGRHGKVGTLIGSELVKVVASRYRTLEKPEFWAIGGQSSGGWGAFNIGLRKLDTFKIFFSTSGYFSDKSGAVNSPQTFIATIPKKQRLQLKIYLDAGKQEKRFLKSTQKFHKTLTKLGIKHEFYAFPGGHGADKPNFGWNYWHQHLYDQLSFVGKHWK